MAIDRKKLAKLCEMFRSDQDGEVATAARKATEMLTKAGVTWSIFLTGSSEGFHETETQRPQNQRTNYYTGTEGQPDQRGDKRWDDFSKKEPERAAWIANSKPTFEFAESLYHAVRKYGRLTERQAAAVDRCIARDEQRDNDNESQTSSQRARGGSRRSSDDDDNVPY